MSKKRPAESSWDSDEELLNDTTGSAITAFPKTSELDLLGDDGELDEDALLGVDDVGTKTTSISFTNDSMWPLTTRQRSKGSISHQDNMQDSAENEQAFVFEETDTADLEDELNVGGQDDDGSGYHVGGDDYTASLYHRSGERSSADAIGASDDRHVDFTVHGMTSDSREIGYMTEQTTYRDDSGAEFGDTSASGEYMGDAGQEAQEDASGVELEYEQPVEHDEQVHLEYDDSHNMHQDGILESEEGKQNYESESDSDNENSRHNRGKFTSERTGVISLTPTNTRETIPDTLEINEEQAAQIEQFMSDKTQKSKGKGKNQGRVSAHSRLGNKSNNRHQQNANISQGQRKPPFPRGILNQNVQMGFPFPGGPSTRGPFPGGLLNPRGPFPMRLLNPQGPFPGPQNNRQPFPMRPGAQRPSFPARPLNMLMGGPQRGPFPHQHDRFPGPHNQRGPFPGNSQPPNLRSPQPGLQQVRGPPPNQLRTQGSFNQRMPNHAQLRQQNPQMRQPGVRMAGSAMTGPRPLMGQAEPGMRFVRPVRPPGGNQGHPIPSLVRPGTNLDKSLLGNQQIRPAQINPLMPQDARRVSPHQRLGPSQGQNRFQNPTGQTQRPRFMARTPGPEGPFISFPVFQGNQQQQPLHMSGQGDMQAQTVRKHKIYINPRFQGQQQAPVGNPNIGRTVKMGAPIQQKAKALLDRAIQNQNRQPVPVSTAQAGVKRKSTGEESVPIKVIKSDPKTPAKQDTTPARVVQASNEPVKEDSQEIKALLEEQKRKREMIQKRKEIARQKQAALKRMELEKRLKEEGKTLSDILRTTKTEDKAEQKETVPPVKQISGSVAARLGPPPPQQQQQQQQFRGSFTQQQGQVSKPAIVKIRPPLSQEAPAFQKSQQFSVSQQTSPYTNQPQATVQSDHRMRGTPPNNQARLRGPSQTNDPRLRGPSQTNDPRLRGPPSSSDPRMRGPPPDDFRFRAPPPTNKPRFQTPISNQFQTPPPNYNTQYQTPPPPQDHSFQVPPPNTQQRLRGPPPVTEAKLRAPPHQTTIQSSAGPSPSVRYTTPPPAPAQTVRYQAPLSAPPPQSSVQVHSSQQYPAHYTQTSASVSHPPPSQYSQPTQADQTMYSAPPSSQYAAQAAGYQQPAYSHPVQHQYEINTHQPPPPITSQTYSQPAAPQYTLETTQQQYSAPELSQYQVPAAQPQYHTPTVQSHYQAPTAQTRYQPPPPTQPILSQPPPTQPVLTQPPPSQSTYQATQYQATQYQTTPYQTTPYQTTQYQNPPPQYYQSSSAETYSNLEASYQPTDYYSEPQPIQTVTSKLTTTPTSIGDQRTVQHHTVGQRIQTISQRAQPVSGTQIRSIIHNVAAQPSQATTKESSTHPVQSQATGGKVMTDGQVQVLDGPQKILIQNVPAMATKETLIKICRHFGQVLGVNLMPEQHKAVVQFQKGEQAARCVAKCNQRCLHKTRLTVKLLPS